MLSDLRVLIADDDITVRHHLRSFLQSRGLSVRLARQGPEAVKKAQDKTIATVLMDIVMSGAYDGIEAARLIRQDDRHKQVIFFTAWADTAAYRERINAAGLSAAAIIHKPLPYKSTSREKFVEILRESLEVYANAQSDDVVDSVETSSFADTDKYSLVRLDTIDLLLYRELQANPELVQALDWRVFEKLLADILETFGYRVDLMSGTKDGGIDIVAFQRSAEWGEHKYLLQAKRWRRRVGVEPVQRLLFKQTEQRASKSCLATTSTFTRGAWKIGKEYEWQLSLLDFNGVKDWVERALRKKLDLIRE
jgi:CheY-like chemotaxis protein